MAITQIGTTQVATSGSGASVVTTGAINTTGATLLVVTIAGNTSGGSISTAAVGDTINSTSNTWVFVSPNQTDGSAGETGVWISYNKAGGPLVTGAGHTVSVTFTLAESITFSAFSGTLGNQQNPVDTTVAGSNSAGNASTTTLQPGAITATSSSLVVTSLVVEHATTYTISAPYTIGGFQTYSSGNSFGAAVAFATGVTTTNPTWTVNTTAQLGATIVSFLAAATPPTGTSPSPVSTLVLNPIRSSTGPVQIGQSVLSQVALLSQGISNPQRLSEIMYESVQALLSQIQAIQNLLNAAPAMQSISVDSADIQNLTVGGVYGPGQLIVESGPPSFAQVGWVGTDPGSLFPVLAISSISGGVVTTSTNHNLAPNQVVFIAGTNNVSDNGTFVVATTPLATTFTAVGVSGNSSQGTVQRLGVGGWFKTLAVGGKSYADVVTNQDGAWIDENGIPHWPIQYLQRATAAVMLDGPNGSLTLNGFTWTSNSPAGEVSWSAGMVNYQNIVYNVAAGNTSATFFIYWQKASPNVFQTSSGFPTLGADDFVVAENLKVGTTGVYSALEEIHDATTLAGGLGGHGNRSIVSSSGISMYNETPNFGGSFTRTGTASDGSTVLRLADGTGTGSLGSGQKIIATGSDGKVQMATFEVDISNSSGGNTLPNFKNMTAIFTPGASSGTLLSTGNLSKWIMVNVDGVLLHIPCF